MMEIHADQLRLPPPVFFLSDAHLGAEPEPIASRQKESFLALCEKIAQEHGALVLNGDLFDFWYEWKTVVPKQYFWLLHALRKLVEQGCEVHLLPGNHDFRLHGFLEQEVGIRTHRDALSLQIAEQKLFVFHGDGLLKSDHGYRFIRRVFRNPVSQKVFSWLHPDLGMWLARGTSQQSRNATKGNPAEDKDYMEFALKKIDEGFSGVVLGHAHRPQEIQHNGGTYVNLGDWIYHYTYAVHDGKSLQLKRWFEGEAK
jgi:UDP-2,3-diacylglucosamine hydrolase